MDRLAAGRGGRRLFDEQITDFMIANDQPALALPGFYPIITEKKKNPKTGKDKVELVKPAFEPEWIFGRIEKADTADSFVTDLGKDFEKLIEGRSNSSLASLHREEPQRI